MSTRLPTQGIEELSLSAKENFQRKNYAQAQLDYETLCGLDPKNGFFADRCAYCFIATAQWQDGEAAWSRVIESHGVNVGRLNYQVQCLLELRRFACAEKTIEKNRALIKPNATFLIHNILVALAKSDLQSALASSRALALTDTPDKIKHALDQLGWRLRTMRSHFDSDVLLAFIDECMNLFEFKISLLRTGLTICRLISDRPRQKQYAAKMACLEPDNPRFHLAEADSLIENGEWEEAEIKLIQIKKKFSAPDFGPELGWEFECAETKLQSRRIWSSASRAVASDSSFETMNLQAMVCIVLNRINEAIDICHAALKHHGAHPWFAHLLGRCHKKLGACDLALQFYAQAAEAETTQPGFLISLLKLQSGQGLMTDSARSLRRLSHQYPNLPIVKSLVLDHLHDAQAAEDLQHPTRSADNSETLTWLHGGDSGDLIYSLAAMQAGGGGLLYLSCIDETREPMDEAKIAFLSPLLCAQSYVSAVSIWRGEPIFRNFNVARYRLVPDVNIATQFWKAVDGEHPPDIDKAWLKIPAPHKHGRPVFARSLRYRAVKWERFWNELKKSCPDAIFLGTTDEFQDFGHGVHHLAKDALELASVIAGASVFVGNQSLPYAIAEGLKVGRLLEVSPFVKNCNFPGALSLNF